MSKAMSNKVAIICDGVKYVVLTESAEEQHLCYCEWLFEITTHSNPLLEREILVSLYIENLTLT